MAESPEHQFLAEAFNAELEAFSRLDLYSSEETARRQFDFASTITRSWSRVLVGQTLWRHTEGIEKDVRSLLFEQEADIKATSYEVTRPSRAESRPFWTSSRRAAGSTTNCFASFASWSLSSMPTRTTNEHSLPAGFANSSSRTCCSALSSGTSPLGMCTTYAELRFLCQRLGLDLDKAQPTKSEGSYDDKLPPAARLVFMLFLARVDVPEWDLGELSWLTLAEEA